MDDLLARLSRVDSCAVSDALDKLGLDRRGDRPATPVDRPADCGTRGDRQARAGRRPSRGRAASGHGRHRGGAAGRRDRRRAANRHRRGGLGRQSRRSAPSCAASPASSSKARPGTWTNAAMHDFPCSPGPTPRAPPADASSKPARTCRSPSATSLVSPGDYVVADGSAVVFVARDRDRAGARGGGRHRARANGPWPIRCGKARQSAR